MNFRVVPIPAEIARRTREKLVSPQFKGMPADVKLATGYGPCRSCLQVFEQGIDERIYITYNAFEGLSTLPGPGPIFLHKKECERFEQSYFPTDLLDLPILLEGFGEESLMLRRVEFDPNIFESQIEAIFELPTVRFINLRNAEAGCFIARVERS